MDAIVGVIDSQVARALLRNCGVKTERTYKLINATWTPYREALGAFLERHPNAHMRRAEHVTSSGQLELAKQADARLAGSRPLEEVHNAHLRFHKTNPLALHVLIGEREVVLALPELSDQAGSSTAFVFRDPDVVDRFTEWFDVLIWDPHGHGSYRDVGVIDGFKHFDREFDGAAEMYGFDRPPPADELN
jgi:hypothetical protein